ncbi:hypothetical protein [Undibacterium sp. TJN19]|uniref:hypothetical protein n=1 Tax=Undibacterium sp. TJN19 TaxID=3413055 RepID=UPI003BF12C11
MKTQLPSQQQQSLQVPQVSTGKALLPADFHDSRPLATLQRRLQTLADNSPQTQQLQTVARTMQARPRQKQLAGIMQQKPGQTRPSFQMKTSAAGTAGTTNTAGTGSQHQGATAQRKLDAAKLNVAGEDHGQSDAEGERSEEKRFSAAVTKSAGYWTEGQFTISEAGEGGAMLERPADPPMVAIRYLLSVIRPKVMLLEQYAKAYEATPKFYASWLKWRTSLRNNVDLLSTHILRATEEKELKISGLKNPGDLASCANLLLVFFAGVAAEPKPDDMARYVAFSLSYDAHAKKFVTSVGGDVDAKAEEKDTHNTRNIAMDAAANSKHAVKGVWKVGEDHVTGIAALVGEKQYNLVTRAEFRTEMEAFQARHPRPQDCVIL